MVTLKELMTRTEFDRVWDVFAKHYATRANWKEKYRAFWDRLSALTPEENRTNMHIYINITDEDGRDFVSSDSFDELNPGLCFDVCGMDDAWCEYSLAGIRAEQWLGFHIDDATLAQLSAPGIVAHCLWEMTSTGL